MDSMDALRWGLSAEGFAAALKASRKKASIRSNLETSRRSARSLRWAYWGTCFSFLVDIVSK
jgi:hypothetical protein